MVHAGLCSLTMLNGVRSRSHFLCLAYQSSNGLAEMRLAAKLILLFLSGLMLIVAIFSYSTLAREKEIAVQQHQRYAAEMARMLEDSRMADSGPSGRPILSQKLVQIRRVELSSNDQSRRPRVPREQIIITEETTSLSMPDARGHDHFYTYIPVPAEGGGQAERIEVSAPDVDSESRFFRTLHSSLLTLLSVSGLSALVVYFGGVRMVGRPLEQLIVKVNRIADGRLDQPVQIRTKDELSSLGRAINKMCERLAKQRAELESETAARVQAVEQLRHADRLRSVGRIAAGLAHEIGTPLNVIAGRAELIETGGMNGDAVKESAREIRAQAERITKIISGVLEFSGSRPADRRQVDVRDVVLDTLNLMEPLVRKSDATLTMQLPEQPVMAEIDSSQLQQVLTNLIDNASQSGPAPEVHVSLASEINDQNGWFLLSVQDNGAGIAPDEIEHVFDPFYTTKDVGKGTGLGLAISHGIVEDHGGRIDVSSQPGQGSCFTLRIPCAAQMNE